MFNIFSASDKARETWKRYLDRDNSRVVDIFVGQLKSCLKCTTCGYASNTFDPLWQLSLPIKKVNTYVLACIILFNGTIIKCYRLTSHPVCIPSNLIYRVYLATGNDDMSPSVKLYYILSAYLSVCPSDLKANFHGIFDLVNNSTNFNIDSFMHA